MNLIQLNYIHKYRRYIAQSVKLLLIYYLTQLVNSKYNPNKRDVHEMKITEGDKCDFIFIVFDNKVNYGYLFNIVGNK